jgi:hypothetical protein
VSIDVDTVVAGLHPRGHLEHRSRARDVADARGRLLVAPCAGVAKRRDGEHAGGKRHEPGYVASEGREGVVDSRVEVVCGDRRAHVAKVYDASALASPAGSAATHLAWPSASRTSRLATRAVPAGLAEPKVGGTCQCANHPLLEPEPFGVG